MQGLQHSAPVPRTKRVLILGGGFGGVHAALRLDKLLARHDDLEVMLVTRENYFLFTPMLPEVAAGELESSAIINPLRRLLRRVKSFVGTIEAIDQQRGGSPCLMPSTATLTTCLTTCSF